MTTDLQVDITGRLSDPDEEPNTDVNALEYLQGKGFDMETASTIIVQAILKHVYFPVSELKEAGEELGYWMDAMPGEGN